MLSELGATANGPFLAPRAAGAQTQMEVVPEPEEVCALIYVRRELLESDSRSSGHSRNAAGVKVTAASSFGQPARNQPFVDWSARGRLDRKRPTGDQELER